MLFRSAFLQDLSALWLRLLHQSSHPEKKDLWHHYFEWFHLDYKPSKAVLEVEPKRSLIERVKAFFEAN